MPSIERIEQIVMRSTESVPNEVQLLRDELLQRWHEWPVDTTQDFCTFAKSQIETLSKNMRGIARRALRDIQAGVSMEADMEARRATLQRQSARRMEGETQRCFDTVNRNEHGVVYLGSARLQSGTPFYEHSRELGREVCQLLGSTSWSGAGPGLMEAPLIGALEAGGHTAGVKILLESDQSFFEQNINPALQPENVAECRYFAPRKVGLVEAAMRDRLEDRTAIIVLPGGFGTIDEWSEYVVLKQLGKLGTNHPVPILLMNYEGYYDPLKEFLHQSCIERGTIRKDELKLFDLCRDNFTALEILAETYDIPPDKRPYLGRVHPNVTLRAASPDEHSEAAHA